MNNYILVMDPMYSPHLEHGKYKYIKRYWKNGHWNYVYPKEGSSTATRYRNNYEQNMIRYNQTLKQMSKLGQDFKSQNAEYDKQAKDLQKESYYIKASKEDASKKISKEKERKYKKTMKSYDDKLALNNNKKSALLNQRRNANTKYEITRSELASKLTSYGKKAAIARKAYTTVNSEYKKKVQEDIKKWESTPLSKIQTAVHKGLDWISKLFKKKG
ncbi:MAG: hypothetical protein J6Y02_07480 [Pseudobutyrivibrio sp.]|nr:hypothetical protein [Pseudobutyrivibrio sp.]